MAHPDWQLGHSLYWQNFRSSLHEIHSHESEGYLISNRDFSGSYYHNPVLSGINRLVATALFINFMPIIPLWQKTWLLLLPPTKQSAMLR
jgi:hypothetical protein